MGGHRVEFPPSRLGDSLRRPGSYRIACGICRLAPGHGVEDPADEMGLAKEGSQMLVVFLLLAGLLLWATGHMILR